MGSAKMAKKILPGWSTQQQGGFRRGGTIRSIYSKPKPINQGITVSQAAGLGYYIKSWCINLNCRSRKIELAQNKLCDHPNISNYSLIELARNAKCSVCSEVDTIELKYTKNKKIPQ